MIYDKKIGIYFSTKINDNDFFSGFGTKKTKLKQIVGRDRRIFQLKQIHSDKIVCFNYLNKQEEGDGMYTNDKHVVITVQTADCVPIIYADKKKKIIGISHQGWKGTQLRLTQKMIRQFLNLNSMIKDLRVAIGPSIGSCCYNIDEERLKIFKVEFASYPQSVFDIHLDKPFLNLSYLNYLQLIEMGLNKEQIDFFPFCTKCHEKHFYSFRRDGLPIKKEMTNFVVFS